MIAQILTPLQMRQVKNQQPMTMASEKRFEEVPEIQLLQNDATFVTDKLNNSEDIQKTTISLSDRPISIYTAKSTNNTKISDTSKSKSNKTTIESVTARSQQVTSNRTLEFRPVQKKSLVTSKSREEIKYDDSFHISLVILF